MATLKEISITAGRNSAVVDRGPTLAARIARCARACAALAGSETLNAGACFVPGRVELAGKHTDYAGGRSLSFATRQGICMVFAPRDDGKVRILDSLRNSLIELPGPPRPGDSWRRYPEAVVERLARDFPPRGRGLDLAFASDLPAAAGLSSSSALVTGFYLALAAVDDPALHPAFRVAVADETALADYLGCIESGDDFGPLTGGGGVGTRGGSQDHAAILLSRRNEIGLWSYRPTRRLGSLAMPRDWRFAIATSGVIAAKAGAARERYNRASRLAEAAAAAWRLQTGSQASHLGAILDEASPEEVREVLERSGQSTFDAEELVGRFEHFVTESRELVPATAAAVEVADVAALGRAAARSQALAERLLHNQVPETSDLVRLARAEGAGAASAFGAGFGGSVWAQIPAAESRAFLLRWQTAYAREHPERKSARFLLTHVGRSARILTKPPPSASRAE